MYISTMQMNAKPAFRVTHHQADTIDILGEITLYLTTTNYCHITIEEAVALRNALDVGIAEAYVARAAREAGQE